MRVLPPAAYVFADLERLSAHGTRQAAQVQAAIRSQAPDALILNDPDRTLCRFELLAELHERGLNPFRAYRLSETTTPARFPVFLRYEHDHTGATSALAADQDELDRAIVRALVRGHSLRDLLIVEYVETSSDDGYYRKYGAFVIGDRIIPRHLFFDTEWVVKSPGLRDPGKVEEEMSYLHDNPHAGQLSEIARLAQVQYGRIDYSVLDGRPVVWEINTNPFVITGRDQQVPGNLPRQGFFVHQFSEALREISTTRAGKGEVVLPAFDRLHVSPSRFGSLKGVLRRRKRRLLPMISIAERVAMVFRRPILALWNRHIARRRES